MSGNAIAFGYLCEKTMEPHTLRAYTVVEDEEDNGVPPLSIIVCALRHLEIGSVHTDSLISTLLGTHTPHRHRCCTLLFQMCFHFV